MVVSIFSSRTAPSTVIEAVIAGCAILAIIMVLFHDRSKPGLDLFSHLVMVYVIPFLFVFAYLTIIWGERILTR